VRPIGVVLDPEGVHRGLHRRHVRPHLHVVEQFTLQGLVEPLHLPRRGRAAGLGMTGNDPVLPADPLEHHLRGPGLVEAASELLAIVAEYLVRDAAPPELDLAVLLSPGILSPRKDHSRGRSLRSRR
jgi:hypothetical protein